MILRIFKIFAINFQIVLNFLNFLTLFYINIYWYFCFNFNWFSKSFVKNILDLYLRYVYV